MGQAFNVTLRSSVLPLENLSVLCVVVIRAQGRRVLLLGLAALLSPPLLPGLEIFPVVAVLPCYLYLRKDLVAV